MSPPGGKDTPVSDTEVTETDESTLLALGGVGFVSATANLAPAATARMYELWQAGEFDQARDLHFGLHPVTDVIFTETNPAAAKWVLAQAGLIRSGYVRPPLVPLTKPPQRKAG